ncbi:MAG: phosphatase PAP2 family protein [Pseudomonadota bacterium]|nr:phosphatase PAP2 family protein [Pseudomonadota bacterium]
MDESAPASAGEVAHLTADAIGFGLRFLRKHGWRMMLWFVCLLLPLWGFASLVGEYHEKAVFPFDAPILNTLHKWATPALDRFFISMTRVGYTWGVVPLDAMLLVFLALRRRFRDGLFFGIAVIGSAILNIAAKNYFARTRPDLWISLMPETTYSFPSGHAMGSATLGLAMILLCWPTRWRWLVTIETLVLVLLIGVSRVYLGVHYPSDILAGWTAAIAWTFGMYMLVDQKAPPPPPSAAPGKDTIGVKT